MDNLKRYAVFPGALLAVILSTFAIQVTTGFSCGITPRTMQGVACIPFASLFHADWRHLGANFLPLAILSALFSVRCGSFGKSLFMTVALSTGGGAITWITGSHGLHLGASILVFAYFGYLLAGGANSGGSPSKRIGNAILGIIALFGYGYLLQGMLIVSAETSWAGHAGGLATGFLLGRKTN